jgi:hypothetical protein
VTCSVVYYASAGELHERLYAPHTVRPTGEFRLHEADGATTLTMSLRAELAGLKRLFMSGMVQKTMDAEVAAIENVKRLLES